MISKKLVEMNGGAIEVYSEGQDRGSIFTFSMKMCMPQEKSILEDNGKEI